MTDSKTIKRFILRVLLAAGGSPMAETTMDIAVKDTLQRPLQSDIDQARRELEGAGFILGTRDELDGGVSWALTVKGELKAKQL
jgi:hypothetical protein